MLDLRLGAQGIFERFRHQCLNACGIGTGIGRDHNRIAVADARVFQPRDGEDRAQPGGNQDADGQDQQPRIVEIQRFQGACFRGSHGI